MSTNCPHGARPPSGGEGGTIEEIRAQADGYGDGLVPLEPLDLSSVRSADDLVRAMSLTAFGGRRLGEAADVMEAMIRDPDCLVVMTLSGAMTIAKMGLIICDMVDRGWVQAVVSTGALVCHGVVEAAGKAHFKADPNLTDAELYRKGYDRVYDTFELESSLDYIETVVHHLLAEMPAGAAFGSAEFNREFGRWLAGNAEGRGILRSAYERDVPFYVPAFTDSELGLDVALYLLACEREGREPPRFDPFRDLAQYTDQILAAPRCGIFTIGGGVPRNWAQQVAPYVEIMRVRLQEEIPLRRFRYGVRLCPEDTNLGGLSGCTYEEGVSWGKFLPPDEGGRYAEVYADATIAWPLLAKALDERLRADPPEAKSF